jgi:DNA repair protein RadC
MGKLIEFLSKRDRLGKKVLDEGGEGLSDEELLAVMLELGTDCSDAKAVAKKIVKYLDDHPYTLDLEELQRVEGVEPEEAAFIAAAFEFGNRCLRPVGIKIERPAEVLPLIRHYVDHKLEHLFCISLNGANEVIDTRIVSFGPLKESQIHTSMVLSDPLVEGASTVILARSTPSSDLTPKEEDFLLTRRLKKAGETLRISVLDFIIFNRTWHYSFLDNGYL